MAGLAQFGSDTDKTAQGELANGARRTESLKQRQYSPLAMEEQVVVIYASTPQDERDSWIRAYELEDIGRYELELLDFLHSSHSEVLDAIGSSGKLEDEVERKLIVALDEFAKVFQPSRGGSKEEAA